MKWKAKESMILRFSGKVHVSEGKTKDMESSLKLREEDRERWVVRVWTSSRRGAGTDENVSVQVNNYM